MDHLPKLFKDYLENSGVSPKTLVNYVSDLSNFLTWAKSPSSSSLTNSFTPDFLAQYRNYLIETNVPVGTVNRRLSALRHFGRFLVWYKLIKENPAEKLENLPRDGKQQLTNPLLARYIENLKQNGATSQEIKKTRETLSEFLRIAD